MKATHIMVVQAGWVFVGTKTPSGLKDAACIRRWGTTKGLGQLALTGPTSETVLDPCGTVEVAPSAVLFYIPVVGSNWR